MMRFLILPVVAIASALASVPVRDACSEDASILANVQAQDPVQVRHAVVGEAMPCYSVVVTQAGKEVQGFILDTTLPAIQAFERTRALESRVSVPVAPEAAPDEKKPQLHPIGPRFETWSGVAVNGRRIQIVPGGAPATLVTFWSAESGTARRFVKHLMPTESEFGAKGLKSYGLVEAANASRAGFYLDDLGLVAPQALDRQRLAAKYNADPAKGTTLVVDASGNVVAISSNPVEIRAAVATLLSSK
jgi:hypothetical protein